MKHRNIRFCANESLYSLLQAESKFHSSWSAMLIAICHDYFLHRQLKEEFQNLDKEQSK